MSEIDTNQDRWLSPTPKMLDDDPIFDAIFNTIKSWDVNVPKAYDGYCGANGNHVRAIYCAVFDAMKEPGDKIEAQLLYSDKWQSMDGKNGVEQFMDPFDAWREILRLAMS